MKIKSDGKGGWKLLGAPPGTRLRRVTVTFPSDGSLESISNVAIEW
jgi:hypothetical protein